MTNYILDLVSVLPLSKNKPRQAIVLCHGYGGDGKDISTLAINWQRFLPNAIFLCPNAPEICEVNPQGFQWFDPTEINSENILLNFIWNYWMVMILMGCSYAFALNPNRQNLQTNLILMNLLEETFRNSMEKIF